MSDAARDALAALAADPARTGVLLDFDGTLAPIVDDPTSSRPLPGSLTALRRLAARLAVVAVVSGRPAAFLAERLGLAEHRAPIQVLGLYGLEELDATGRVVADPSAAPWLDAVAEVVAEAGQSLPPGVLVEDKRLSVAFHWRRDPGASGIALDFAARAAERLGFQLSHGKMSVELLPPTGAGKGRTVRRLCAGLSAACFIGDDSGDLPAFRALASLQTHGSPFVGIRIAAASSEVPAALLAEADAVLDGPSGVGAFLGQLVERVCGP